MWNLIDSNSNLSLNKKLIKFDNKKISNRLSIQTEKYITKTFRAISKRTHKTQIQEYANYEDINSVL